jgi:hypothetical protein
MNRVIKVIPYPDFSLDVHFADGLVKHIDMRPFIRGDLGAPLGDWNYFRQVTIDEGGGITWPNGYDFCPEYLHDYVEASEPLARVMA